MLGSEISTGIVCKAELEPEEGQNSCGLHFILGQEITNENETEIIGSIKLHEHTSDSEGYSFYENGQWSNYAVVGPNQEVHSHSSGIPTKGMKVIFGTKKGTDASLWQDGEHPDMAVTKSTDGEKHFRLGENERLIMVYNDNNIRFLHVERDEKDGHISIKTCSLDNKDQQGYLVETAVSINPNVSIKQNIEIATQKLKESLDKRESKEEALVQE